MFDKSMFMKKFENKKKLDPTEKEAKLGVAKELSKQAGAMLSDKAKPKAKVEVAADSKEGLKAGLQKAEDLVEGAPGEEDMESVGEAKEESAEAMEISEEEKELSPEELDEKIQKLQELKASKEGDKVPNGNPFAAKEKKNSNPFS